MSAIRVLVVDDSAFARKVLREVLSSAADMEVVGIARDGLDALEKVEELRPDVVTLDLRMPNLDGVGVLQALQGRTSPRCVVVSTSDEESDLAIRALQAGAVDLVHKPTALATDQLYEVSTDLLDKVRVAAGARARVAPAEPPAPPVENPTVNASRFRLVVIGASTGGPQAVTRLLSELPGDFPVPIAVVLHMPVGYTAALAERLNDVCAIEVAEARDGVAFRPGLALVARAGMHLKIAGGPDDARARLDVTPLDTPHRPSVDVLFTSAAHSHGGRVLGVVLTGMGEDGLVGARAIRDAGGSMITEAESSCVVYGMPRAVAEAGQSDQVVPIERAANAIQHALSRR
jgi:two-component system, chemotaxis family, protein-glutamate methylesterase/glutaminase